MSCPPPRARHSRGAAELIKLTCKISTTKPLSLIPLGFTSCHSAGQGLFYLLLSNWFSFQRRKSIYPNEIPEGETGTYPWMLQQGVRGALLGAHTGTSTGNFHLILPFRAKHKGRGGEFAFLPLFNSAVCWETPGREEQQRPLFAGRETVEKQICKIHVQLLQLPDGGFMLQPAAFLSFFSRFCLCQKMKVF